MADRNAVVLQDLDLWKGVLLACLLGPVSHDHELDGNQREKFLGAQGVAVQVSLDGSRPEVHDAVRGPGSFAGALRAIGLLQEAGLAAKLAVCATVMRGNARDLGEIVRLAERIGVPRVRFLPLRRAGMARERWEEIAAGLGPEDHERFYDEIAARGAAAKPAAEVSCGLSGFVLKPPPGSDAEEILCPVGRKIALEADGEAFPCELLTGASHRLGTIHRGSLAALMRSVGMRRSCAELCARRRVIERCASCLWSNLCQGGCMGQAADHAGTIWAVDDFCDYRRRAYGAAFDRILGLEAAAAP